MRRKGSRVLALAIAVAAMSAKLPAAHGQITRRLALHAEVGAGTMFSEYQRDTLGYGLVLNGTVRGAFTVLEPLAVQVSVGSWWFPAAPRDAGQLYTAAAGLRVDARIGARVRLMLDGDLAVARTGDLTRLAFDLGAAATFPISPSLAVGPQARYVQVVADRESDHPSDAALITVGLIVSVRAAAPEVQPRSDRDHDGIFDTDDADRKSVV